MKNKIYKLKEDFAGKKAGDVIDFTNPNEKDSGNIWWLYKSAYIEISRTSELLEEIEPIVITTEGVYVYAGESVWIVGDAGNVYSSGALTVKDVEAYKYGKLPMFQKEENAHEYALYHKVCLSVGDVLKILNVQDTLGDVDDICLISRKELIELAKNKLNKI